jgi:hypothetical protein
MDKKTTVMLCFRQVVDKRLGAVRICAVLGVYICKKG